MYRTKKIIIVVSTIIAIILFAVIFAIVSKGNKKALENENKTVEKEIIKDEPQEKEEEEKEPEELPSKEEEKEEEEEKQVKVAEIKYDLKNKNEEFVVDDNLTIKFVGTKEEYGTDMYSYNADIYLNGKNIETKLFNVVDNRVIYSANHNAEFFVEKIDNVYVIVSRVVKHNDGTYAVIMNTDGEVLREFNDVTLTIKGRFIMVGLNTSGDENIYTTFVIDNNKFELKYEE